MNSHKFVFLVLTGLSFVVGGTSVLCGMRERPRQQRRIERSDRDIESNRKFQELLGLYQNVSTVSSNAMMIMPYFDTKTAWNFRQVCCGAHLLFIHYCKHQPRQVDLRALMLNYGNQKSKDFIKKLPYQIIFKLNFLRGDVIDRLLFDLFNNLMLENCGQDHGCDLCGVRIHNFSKILRYVRKCGQPSSAFYNVDPDARACLEHLEFIERRSQWMTPLDKRWMAVMKKRCRHRKVRRARYYDNEFDNANSVEGVIVGILFRCPKVRHIKIANCNFNNVDENHLQGMTWPPSLESLQLLRCHNVDQLPAIGNENSCLELVACQGGCGFDNETWFKGLQAVFTTLKVLKVDLPVIRTTDFPHNGTGRKTRHVLRGAETVSGKQLLEALLHFTNLETLKISISFTPDCDYDLKSFGNCRAGLFCLLEMYFNGFHSLRTIVLRVVVDFSRLPQVLTRWRVENDFQKAADALGESLEKTVMIKIINRAY